MNTPPSLIVSKDLLRALCSIGFTYNGTPCEVSQAWLNKLRLTNVNQPAVSQGRAHFGSFESSRYQAALNEALATKSTILLLD